MKLTWVIRTAIVAALIIGTFFSVKNSLESWFQNPIVSSVSMRDVEHIAFPAVTVCYPNPGKWMGIAKALDHYDTQGLIFDLMNNQSDLTLQYHFTDGFTLLKDVIRDSFEPRLAIDHTLPQRIGLSNVETELFYLIHLAIFELTNQSWSHWRLDIYLRSELFNIKLKAVLKHKTRAEATQDIKEYICKTNGMNCTFTEVNSWFLCNEMSTVDFPVLNNWCQDCRGTLQDCLQLNSDSFIIFFASFYYFHEHFTKENLIKAVLTRLLAETSRAKREETGRYVAEYTMLDQMMANYISLVKPIPNTNVTVVDVWNYITGDYHNALVPFETYLDKKTTKALEKCLDNGVDCDLADAFSKVIEMQADHSLFTNPTEQEFIPYCNFASWSNPQVLEHCNLFTKETTSFQMEQCFTFNNEPGNQMKLNDSRVGNYDGFNFMINFNQIGTERQKIQPAKMILHEPGTYPGSKFSTSKHVLIDPGHVLSIKIKPTVTETTSDFDKMSFESRQCSTEKNYHDINCLLDEKLNLTLKQCGCLPWFVNSSSSSAVHLCNFEGIHCFQKNMAKKPMKDCPPACTLIKYSTSFANQKSMLSIDSNLQDFGLEDYFKRENLKSLLIDYEEGIEEEVRRDYLKNNLKKVSLIHLNFDDFQATVMTNDAKLTPINMIGNLGGLLGVFLGFSFLGFLDTIIEFCTHQLMQKVLLRLIRAF